MASKIVLGNFGTILARTKQVLAQGKRVPDPFATARSLQVFKDAVAEGRRIMPHRFQGRYVDVLDQVVQQAERVLNGLQPSDEYGRQEVVSELRKLFSVVAAPIVQLGSSEHQRELKAFLAEISNIYGRFINDDQVRRGARIKILSPDLEPLGAFGHDKIGPFTLPATEDLPVPIVSKPARQMNFLPLWAADGHEVGGHDIYGAVEGFEEDLKKALESNLRLAFRSGRITTSQATVTMPRRGGFLAWLFGSKPEISMEDFMVQVWSAWLSEASSDHAGLVNLGPMYLDALMLLVMSLRLSAKLSHDGLFDRRVFGEANGFEEHPIDVVRVLLNIEAIKHLSVADAGNYAQALKARLIAISGGRLPSVVGFVDRKGERVIEVSLVDFEAVLPVVVETILDAKLPALGNQSFGEILNWSDSDEAIVAKVSRKLSSGDRDFDDDVEARHVVAASMLAMEAASLHGSFAEAAKVIHDTGISMLKEMYDMQCIFCLTGPTKSTCREVDLTRLLNHVMSH